MHGDTSSARFERRRDSPTASPTLIEGLPGLGMVASIAVDQVTTQLGLDEYGSIDADELPPVAAFDSGRVRDAVRVYAGDDPAVMTLQSDVPIPSQAFEPLTRCVLNDLAEEIDRAIFLAGTPAQSNDEVGEVVGIATTDGLETALADVDVQLAEGPGVVGGVTGALLSGCYRADVPAAVLVVRASPYIPDPGAAGAVIEDALEPLVEFDVDTRELHERAEEIQQQKRRLAEQLQQYQQREGDQSQTVPGMYQ